MSALQQAWANGSSVHCSPWWICKITPTTLMPRHDGDAQRCAHQCRALAALRASIETVAQAGCRTGHRRSHASPSPCPSRTAPRWLGRRGPAECDTSSSSPIHQWPVRLDHPAGLDRLCSETTEVAAFSKADGTNVIRRSLGTDARATRGHQHHAPCQYRQPRGLSFGRRT